MPTKQTSSKPWQVRVFRLPDHGRMCDASISSPHGPASMRARVATSAHHPASPTCHCGGRWSGKPQDPDPEVIEHHPRVRHPQPRQQGACCRQHRRRPAQVEIASLQIRVSTKQRGAFPTWHQQLPPHHLMQVAPPQRIDHVIEADIANRRIAALLQIAPVDALLLLKRSTWTQGRVASHVRLTYPALGHRSVGDFELMNQANSRTET